MKTKWLKKQIKRWEYMKSRTKREAAEKQTAVCMILFVAIIIGFIIREVLF